MLILIAAAYFLPPIVLVLGCLREGRTPIATIVATVLLGPAVPLTMAFGMLSSRLLDLRSRRNESR